MHEGHHGIFDDMEDMDDLFGINEGHDHKHHDHNHNHEHHDHEHTHDNSENHHKKKFGLFKKKKADK
ncbi:hypothetical protein [Intestinibacter bartlettii]|uniref:Uncharacterized protein n=1 Tax=Intestinibacter bartlettii TaxID=261299 RepID=A0ABS6DZ79_9FIRM|nr:hypothetical protein [Intestinibacter bartlettii]MBU5337155.1 hypothetical protein [Intestinibacter bartlettii]